MLTLSWSQGLTVHLRLAPGQQLSPGLLKPIESVGVNLVRSNTQRLASASKLAPQVMRAPAWLPSASL